MIRFCAKLWCGVPMGNGKKPYMGNTYKFNLLIYFLVFRIGIRYLPGYYDPFVFPLFPLFALCFLFCFLLVLPVAASWLGFLFFSIAESS